MSFITLHFICRNRLGLPEPWRGVRDKDLAGICKIPGARFVHAAGFIGGAETLEGVIQMAQAALATAPSPTTTPSK
jgi:uncharacterized UPF0160 family protein